MCVFMAKLILLLAIICFSLDWCMCSIWIKGIKSYGPSSAIAGSRCLAILTKYYFYDPTIMRAKNMILSHTRNLTSPAAEVEAEYLYWLHNAVADKDELEA